MTRQLKRSVATSFTFTSFSEDAIHEARRRAKAALDRGEAEYLGLDQTELADAIRDLDRLADQCEAGRYRGNLAFAIFIRVLPLIKDANARLPKTRRRSSAA